MKYLLVLLAASAILVSCSDDYDADDDFYGLTTTKILAYKNYTIDEDGAETFTNKIDTVKVYDKQKLNGINYYKLHHSVYNNGNLEGEKDEYRRVDSKGYLVDEHNAVIHPGFETSYINTENYGTSENPLGTVVYQLGDIGGEIALQNSSYSVYKYVGVVKDLAGGSPTGVVMELDYATPLGVAKLKTRNPGSATFSEDRLVYYERK